MEISAILMNFQPKYADNIAGCDSNLYLAEENFLQKVNISRFLSTFLDFHLL